MSRIWSVDGAWLDKEDDIVGCFSKFFLELFQTSKERDLSNVLSYVEPAVTVEDNVVMCSPVTDAEVREAVFKIGGLKALDLMVLEEQVCGMAKDFFFFENGVNLDNLNNTKIVLIPKVENPELVGSFRPISLCNFSYMIVSKIISNRLSTIIP